MGQQCAYRQNERELSNAIAFLKKRYAENAKDYSGSFANTLNNEAAVEMASLFYPRKIVRRALSVLENAPKKKDDDC